MFPDKMLNSRRSEASHLAELPLRTLRSLGPTVEASLHQVKGRAVLTMRSRRMGSMRFALRLVSSHLSHSLAEAISAEARAHGQWAMVFAPYVPSLVGHQLAAQSISYADAVGNCHVIHDGELFAHVEGKRPSSAERAIRTLRAPSLQTLFALAADPRLVSRPVRQIAAAAGVGKSSVTAQLARMVDAGLLSRGRRGLRIARETDLRDRWLSVYPERVRPRWLVGRYRAQQEDPRILDAALSLLPGRWALGGAAAAFQMNGFYRGADTVIHIDDVPISELTKRLRMVPASDGPITVLRTPGVLAYQGMAPQLAHPFLIYTEMMVATDPRTREAAELVKDAATSFAQEERE